MLQIWRHHFVIVTGRQLRPHSHHLRESRGYVEQLTRAHRSFALDCCEHIERVSQQKATNRSCFRSQKGVREGSVESLAFVKPVEAVEASVQSQTCVFPL